LHSRIASFLRIQSYHLLNQLQRCMCRWLLFPSTRRCGFSRIALQVMTSYLLTCQSSAREPKHGPGFPRISKLLAIVHKRSPMRITTRRRGKFRYSVHCPLLGGLLFSIEWLISVSRSGTHNGTYTYSRRRIASLPWMLYWKLDQNIQSGI
jgi:hypothetical protein